MVNRHLHGHSATCPCSLTISLPMSGLCSARTDHLVIFRGEVDVNVEASTERFRWTQLGFSFHRAAVTRFDYSGSAVVPDDRGPWYGPVAPRVSRRKFARQMDASGSCSFASPRISPSAYTLAYRLRRGRRSGRKGTSPVKLTNHFPEVNPPTTLTLERRLAVCVAVSTNLRAGPPCFTTSRKLALRLGRIVNPPQVLFPGSFDTTF